MRRQSRWRQSNCGYNACVVTAAIIFLLTYTALAIGTFPGTRIDRTGAALIGATFMIVFRCISLEAAYRTMNYHTLVLLFGMMVVVANLRLSGFFRWVGSRVVERAHGPHQLLAIIILSSGILSAFFVNDTVCLIFTPFILDVCRQIPCSPLPYLLALATASNIGSVATITGNPQNMIIGTFSHLSYREFSGSLAPIAAIGFVIDFMIIAWIYREEFKWPSRRNLHVNARVRVFRPLLIKSLSASLLMIAFFFVGGDVAIVALAAAAAILITRRVKPQKVYREIDWELLTLFAGLFVVIAAIENTGLSNLLFEYTGLESRNSLPYLAAVVAGISNLVSNVPAVLLFQSFIPKLPDPKTGWLVLAMASTLAGNLTLLGSIANLIVVQGARHEIKIGFWEYAKAGIPITALTILAGLIWLLR